MGKFKIGDRVRRVKKSSWPNEFGHVGEVYEVLDVDSSEGIKVLELSDRGNNFASPCAFELAVPTYTPAVGDWVRLTADNDMWGKAGDVGRVIAREDKGERLEFVEPVHGGGMWLVPANKLEVWTPKVGERVVEVDGNPHDFVGHWRSYWQDAEGPLVDGVFIVTGVGAEWISYSNREGGHGPDATVKYLQPAPVAAPQPALAIAPGKFYRTRDGRKVGPMVNEGWSDGEPWTAPGYGYCGDSGKWNTMSATPDSDDLIAEWQETTNVGAQVDTLAEEYGPIVLRNMKLHVNDNAAKPKFKVGDRISGYAPAWGDKTGVITKVDETDRNQFYRIRDEDSGFGMWLENYSVKPAPCTAQPTAIVALIEDGKPKPADIPHVHASQAAAEREAKRLAGIHRGKLFGVYVLATTAEEPAPVYAHEWQRLAADGRRPLAVSSLVRTAGIPQGHAERIVGQFAA